jgi:hypothetical protein
MVKKDTASVETWLGYVTQTVTSRRWWFMIVLLLRKFAIAIILATVPATSVGLPVALSFAIVLSIMLTIILRPFRSSLELSFDVAVNCVVLLSYVASVLSVVTNQPRNGYPALEFIIFFVNIVFILGVILPMLLITRVRWIHGLAHKIAFKCCPSWIKSSPSGTGTDNDDDSAADSSSEKRKKKKKAANANGAATEMWPETPRTVAGMLFDVTTISVN